MPASETYGGSWYAESMVPTNERSPLVYDLDVDVCVIGGGLAGLTAAREIARRGHAVVVLEAKQVAWNASGRNGGFVSPGFADGIKSIVERVGIDHAKALWRLSQEGVGYVRATIRETGMPGVDPRPGWLRVSRVDDDQGVADQADLLREFGTDADVWSTAQVRDQLRSPAYFQAIHLPRAFHMHPLNYALGLAAAAEAAGARIFENTPALAIDPAGVRKRVETPKARVRAAHVVLAGGPQLAPLVPLVSRAILPVATYVAATAPLGEKLHDAIRYHGAVTDNRRAGDYYRIVDGNRLLWGGRITTWLDQPRGLARALQRDISKVFPTLEKAEIDHAWTGIMAYTVHKMPLIGEVSPGLWVATGFGGHGLNTTAMGGELIARAIVENDDAWRLFAPYELVWTGEKFGRLAAQTIYWGMQVGDFVAERRARYREAARARTDTKMAQRAATGAARQAAENARKAATAERIRRVAEQEAARATMEAEVQRRAAEERAARQATIDAAKPVVIEPAVLSFSSSEAARLAAAEDAARQARNEEVARLAAEEQALQAASAAAQHLTKSEESARKRNEQRAARQAARDEAKQRRRRDNAALKVSQNSPAPLTEEMPQVVGPEETKVSSNKKPRMSRRKQKRASVQRLENASTDRSEPQNSAAATTPQGPEAPETSDQQP